MSRLVTIARFYDTPAAVCAKSALDAYGIPSFLHNDDLVRLNWHWIPMLQGIKLHVFEEHFDEAQQMLASCQADSALETPVEAFWRRKIINGLMAVVMVLTILPFVPFWTRKRHWRKDHSAEPK